MSSSTSSSVNDTILDPSFLSFGGEGRTVDFSIRPDAVVFVMVLVVGGFNASGWAENLLVVETEEPEMGGFRIFTAPLVPDLVG
jgi:hypothetical protein